MVKNEYHCINNHEIYIFLIWDSRCRIASEGEASDLLATNTRFERTIDPGKNLSDAHHKFFASGHMLTAALPISRLQ